jgi:nucleotide-binding universal stress UspA family protein
LIRIKTAGIASSQCVEQQPSGAPSMIRDLFMPLTGTPGDTPALAAALVLAKALPAHLSIVQPFAMPAPTIEPWGMAPDITDLYAELRGEAIAYSERFRARLEQEGVSFDLRLAESLFMEAPDVAALQARYADMGVTVAPVAGEPRDRAALRRLFGALLFDSGRPVLAVPPDRPIEWPIRRATVAWMPTREGTRALHDALPLLAHAAAVDVVTVEPERGDFGHGDWPGADIAAHLARHGVRVDTTTLPRQDQTIAGVLLRYAAERGAQLLVAGGYGHSRFREWMLGGVTGELLGATHVPILFAH